MSLTIPIGLPLASTVRFFILPWQKSALAKAMFFQVDSNFCVQKCPVLCKGSSRPLTGSVLASLKCLMRFPHDVFAIAARRLAFVWLGLR